MKRSLLVPEVIQTSATDCGPAVLQALLRGYGVDASYERLREACATDVDGTSFDTLEALTEQLGFRVDKALVPRDHLLFPGRESLPAIVVMRLPDGLAHFVLAWRRHGPWVQIMDPGGGRSFVRVDRFLQETYSHALPLPAERWRAWVAQQPNFHEILRATLRRLGVRRADSLVEEVERQRSWRPIAALDASARMVSALVASGGLAPGRRASAMLEQLFTRTRELPKTDDRIVPGAYWSAVGLFNGAGQIRNVSLRGVPIIRIREAPRPRGARHRATRDAPPPAALAAVLEPPTRPFAELWTQLRADGWRPVLVLVATLLAASVAEGLEVVLLRALVDAGTIAPLPHQRLWSIGLVVGVSLGVLLLDRTAVSVALGMGRRLELRLRARLLSTLPRLDDSYFRTRPGSDLASRIHALHRLRFMPDLVQRFGRGVCRLVIIGAGLMWLLPERVWLVAGATMASLALPLATMRPLVERDMRSQVHEGGLSRFYLDALLGLLPIRSHGGEAAVSREHETLVVRWARARRAVARTTTGAQLLQSALGAVVVSALLWPFVVGEAPLGALLLVAYWAMALPVVGRNLAQTARRYPHLRNLTLRLLEPLRSHAAVKQTRSEAKAETSADTDAEPESGSPCPVPVGVEVEFRRVHVCTSRSVDILSDVSLHLEAGSEVAVVGPSGAGKSSLVSVLLGWLRPSAGTVWIDGEPLTDQRLATLRTQTAWVDPAVHLWNRPLFDNLLFGAEPAAGHDLAAVTRDAELHPVLERMPTGLRTSLGEGGGMVSGGEGQRVRLGRAMLRSDARLVVFDEPFRGLDRERRRALLARARARWSHATFVYITHDLSEALEFPRVLVVDGGRVVEDGAPERLRHPASRLSTLLQAEQGVRDELWDDPRWRHLRLRAGQVVSGGL
ncbi:MAG: ATP-binding cassette domain-containing protein [Deltaproteobacteria bacterium]|nr:ATP-binding cassette domain-containing protein [Deltaproteobacteria bacterium]